MRTNTLPELLELASRRIGDKICLSDENEALSGRGLYHRALAVASFLQKRGVVKGDRIGVYMDRSVRQAAVMFGISICGGVFVNINPYLKVSQLENIIEDSQLRIIVVGSRNSFLEFMDVSLISAGIFDVMDISFLPIPLERDDLAALVYTSGSTGEPKGVMLSHGNILETVEISSGHTGLKEDDRVIGLFAFNFDYGLNQLINMLFTSSYLHLYRFTLPHDLLKELEDRNITFLPGMPPIWQQLFKRPIPYENYDLSRIRTILTTGSRLPLSVIAPLKELFPSAGIYSMYGFTEAFRSTCLFPDELEAHPDSIGKALPGVEISIINEQGEECRPLEVGELVHYGAMITQGYWNDPEMTEMKFKRDHVYSGDLVKRDEDGYLYFVGRKDRMMKVKGYRVSPLEIEAVLTQMSTVRQCYVAGHENDEGTLITAFIQKAEERLNAVEVKQFCKENAPYYLVPDDVVFVEDFPYTASGKIDGKALLEHKETAYAV